MTRRWLIRSFTLLLILAVSAAWGRSYFKFGYANDSDDHTSTFLQSDRGRLCFIHLRDIHSYAVRGFQWGESDSFYLARLEWVERIEPDLVHRALGFAYGKPNIAAASPQCIVFAAPYWFVDGAAILIGVYAWRKTRPRPNPATAFPVETGN
jgi:hypothetical protein